MKDLAQAKEGRRKGSTAGYSSNVPRFSSSILPGATKAERRQTTGQLFILKFWFVAIDALVAFLSGLI